MRPQSSLLKDNSGSMTAVTIIIMVAFFALFAIVIDLGRLMLVRNQLQNAADAGALAGARALFLDNLHNTPVPTPDWGAGQTAALVAVKSNKADTQALATCQVQTGYWDTSWTPATAPVKLESTGTTPSTTVVPACKVNIQKIAGSNNGPVTTTFAQIFGIATVNVMAKAAAVFCNPGSIAGGSGSGGGGGSRLFPMAIDSGTITDYFTNHLGTSFQIGYLNYSITDQQYTNSIGDSMGQWTSFGVNDLSAVQNLMATGNPDNVSVNEDIWIEPTGLHPQYNDTYEEEYNYANAYAGQTVLLPVVKEIGNSRNAHKEKVIGFVPFYIQSAQACSNPYLQGYFINGFIASHSGCGGPNIGAYTLELVQ